jgi:membrane protein YdbS with pleckstrin-like domain
MPSIDRRLIGGESVCYRARLHWIAFVGPFAIAVAVGAPGVLLIVFSLAFWMDNFALQSAFATGLLMVVGAVAIALGFLYRTAGIAVTDRRILVTSGVLVKRKAAQWSLQAIDSIEIRQGDLGRVLDYGSIVVHADGKAAGPFRYVSQPWELRRRVEEEIRKPTAVSTKIAA